MEPSSGFQNKCQHHRNDAADKKLNAGELYTIYMRRHSVYQKDVEGEKHSAEDYQHISAGNGKPLLHTQQVCSHQSKEDTGPYASGWASSPEKYPTEAQ